jgi:large subunit ribosomal protein L21
MYAIFEQGSHQFRVQEGDVITLDRLAADAGGEVTFDRILLIAGGEGEPKIGTPLLEGAKVVGTVVRQFRDKKIIIQKFRRRKNYRRKRGHRQHRTTVRITAVHAG